MNDVNFKDGSLDKYGLGFHNPNNLVCLARKQENNFKN